jgi:hypothetical protein
MEGLTDNFSFNQAEDGSKTFNHNIGFTVRTGRGESFTGAKALAGEIARSLFDIGPIDLSVSSFGAYGDFVDSGTAKHYYSETFDEFKRTFSFTKSRDIFPGNSGSYSSDLSHTINYSEQGIFTVQEKIRIEGKQEYSDAEAGFAALLTDSQARCENILTGYFPLAENQYSDSNISNNASLVRTNLSKTYNIPNLLVEGTLSYTNDERNLGAFTKDERFDVSREENGSLSIDHNIQYSLYNQISGNMDEQVVSGSEDILGVMSFERDRSIDAARSVFHTVTGLTGISSGIVRTKTAAKSQDRGKGFSLDMSYTNDPVYDTSQYIDPYNSSPVTGFNRVSMTYSEDLPQDVINEYKVINRPAQTSVLSYGYQQEPAKASVSFSCNMPRRVDNFATPLYYSETETKQLLRYAHQVFFNRALTNADIYNYYLADIKYNFNSSNDFNMTLEFAYTKKKYGNITP